MPETVRTFVALPLTDEMIRQLTQLQRVLKRDCPAQAVNWVAPENIHLTLFFLGEILPELVPPVKEALSVVARHVAPLAFDVEQLGTFPSIRRPSVVWAGIKEPSGTLALLHQVVNEAIEKVGFQRDKRAFSPHLTLGRVRRRASREDAAAVGQAVANAGIGHLGTVAVTEIIFFRSQLRSSGAVYTPLATFALNDHSSN